MGKSKCESGKGKIQKPDHRFLCKKCGHSAKKKERLCKPDKLNNTYP
jgi:hypothetical protein